ncbi:enoyl-CoA hydratase/isomerase family protein [Salinadaptatus halalkaliphilus]|uniref:Enoyl-CoA hydratase/isomerase family protein n=1 Tax=Salinadaptatus halalkaliphilus TaxID=2419781 RepID=A0A4S3TQT7_9EURY|nr:enoyl-CoA hydratase/isomerase family protein [Salinadaptatus halalkaliphilus]THE66000.1 enoyl-CoA hydratase/isomerase family protein [Salinadaptatus halalkaliphilus]
MSTRSADLGNEDLEVTTSDDGVVAWVTIDRPDVHNALSDDVLTGLSEVAAATHERDIRVVVIRGAGGTFCSGGDLQGMDDAEPEPMIDRRRGSSGLADLLEELIDADALTVAAVEGYCLAGGCGLAAGCDFVLAADDAEFGTPEVNVGMFPMQAMAAIMPAVGEKKGLKLMFTGEHIDAETAERIGLATDVLDADAFETELAAYVDDLARNSPVLISMGKEAYYTQRDMTVEQSYSYLKEMLTLLMESEDHEEGVAAFVEDREPEWGKRP